MRDDAEEQRRRLYARGASADDVERFREIAPPTPAVVAEDARRPSPARRLRTVLVVALLGVLVVVGIAVARATASTTATQDGVAAPTPVRMSAEDRQDVEDALAAGHGAGIAAFLVTHREPPALRAARRVDTFETSGTGDGVASIAPVDAATFEGRATVLVALARTGEVAWTLSRREVDPSGEQRLVPQRQRGGVQEAGNLTADTFRYTSGDRPVEIHVEAPAGVRWGVAVVLSD